MLGIAKQAGLMKNDTFPNVKSALLADSIASLVGSILVQAQHLLMLNLVLV